MPGGRPTPLARQLRTALRNISTAASIRPSIHAIRAPPCSLIRIDHDRNRYSTQAQAQAQAQSRDHYTPLSNPAQVSPPESPAPDRDAHPQTRAEEADGRRFRTHGWRRLKRRKRTNHLNQALNDTVGPAVAASTRRAVNKPDLSYVNLNSRRAKADYLLKRRRHANDSIIPDAEYREFSLQRTLSSFIRHQAKANDYLDAEWEAPFTLTPLEAEYLSYRGRNIDDIAAWAEIVSAKDSLDAARSLAERIQTHGPESVPMFVYLHLLRRSYLSALALRILLACVSRLFTDRANTLPSPGIDDGPIIIAVVRLIRHARQVLVPVMSQIVDVLLCHLQHQVQNTDRKPSVQVLSNRTFVLNKIMSLVSLSTSTMPFKDVHFQEAAIVPILQFMADHDPPLQINRWGYRAVVRVQLTQRKTRLERQWAELKAQSWPPWKGERTAMDAFITPEHHGTSKAKATLIRMREAGYAPRFWEKVAQTYTGWDVDRTPTMQMRAIIGNQQLPKLKLGIPWAARIATTRTMQEAWACYLAWEDANLLHDQEVYLAIFEKLWREHQRKRIENRPKDDGSDEEWPLFPGDDRTNAPLPPSTHLYTYTRTTPPTMERLYEQLVERGVDFGGHCLAFLVQHASTLQSGVRMLERGCPSCPEISGLVTFDPACDLSKIPLPIFAAAIGLYARFGSVPLVHALPENRRVLLGIESRRPFLDSYQLNTKLSISAAVELLRARFEPHQPLWDSLFSALTLKSNFAQFGSLSRRRTNVQSTRGAALPDAMQSFSGALHAHRLISRLMSFVREQHCDLGPAGFHGLCVSTERAAVASWSILQAQIRNDFVESPSLDELRADAKAFLQPRTAEKRFQGAFQNLVGQNGEVEKIIRRVVDPTGDGEFSPVLLTMPAPAIFHAYLRALGWLADYDGLLDLVRWMREYRVALWERAGRDRQGQRKMMRKVIIGLRVFLERSWLDDAQPTIKSMQDSKAAHRLRTVQTLMRLSSPADSQIIRAVRTVVEEVEEWEGWPSDEEVRKYIAAERTMSFQWTRKTLLSAW